MEYAHHNTLTLLPEGYAQLLNGVATIYSENHKKIFQMGYVSSLSKAGIMISDGFEEKSIFDSSGKLGTLPTGLDPKLSLIGRSSSYLVKVDRGTQSIRTNEEGEISIPVPVFAKSQISRNGNHFLIQVITNPKSEVYNIEHVIVSAKEKAKLDKISSPVPLTLNGITNTGYVFGSKLPGYEGTGAPPLDGVDQSPSFTVDYSCTPFVYKTGKGERPIQLSAKLAKNTINNIVAFWGEQDYLILSTNNNRTHKPRDIYWCQDGKVTNLRDLLEIKNRQEYYFADWDEETRRVLLLIGDEFAGEIQIFTIPK
ncbi:MAG: hypothetical protein KDC26_11005 [Armatimonadetes bacterium]|nr:hypothetical protein [Armatimonadota bacterium]